MVGHISSKEKKNEIQGKNWTECWPNLAPLIAEGTLNIWNRVAFVWLGRCEGQKEKIQNRKHPEKVAANTSDSYSEIIY